MNAAPGEASARDVGGAYDARAEEYVARFGTVDQHPAADRTLVRDWRDATSGQLLDAGCGPGEWMAVLHDDGRDVVGLDLSSRFLSVGRRSYPTVPFVRGSLAALPLPSGTVGGVLAWYSVIHTPPGALPQVLAEFSRVLRIDGSLLLGVVDGAAGQGFAHSVVTAYSWSVGALMSLLADAGLEVVEHHRRQDPGVRPHADLTARRRR